MTSKQKVLVVVGILLLVGTFLGGYKLAENRYSVSTTTKTEAKETNHTKTVITTVKKPDGTVTTVEQIDSQTKSKVDTIAKISDARKQLTNISLLVGNDFSKSGIIPLYGLSVSRELLGPVTVGAFGLTNGTLGVSIGINF